MDLTGVKVEEGLVGHIVRTEILKEIWIEIDEEGQVCRPNLRLYIRTYYLIDKRDRDYRRDRPDDRRGDPRGDRERDRRGDDRRRDRGDDRRELPRRDDRDGSTREDRKLREYESKGHAPSKDSGPAGKERSTALSFLHFLISTFLPYPDPPKATSSSQSRPNLDPDAPDLPNEDGEAVDDTNDGDAAMMALMGLSNFGSTKVCR